MEPRQGITQIFSTFLQVSKSPCHWQTELKLLRSIEKCLAQTASNNSSEDFWVIHWYQNWQNKPQSLAKGHLLAYLQESGYWAAKKMTRFAVRQYELADYFQIALGEVNKVLQGFNPEQGVKLSYYASLCFQSLIRDKLRQGQEIDICSDWGLLRKVSQKRLKEALSRAGLDSEEIAQYTLAWKGFKSIYIPAQGKKTRNLPKPDLKTWEAITKFYNQERYKQLSAVTQELDARTIEQWLISCAQYIRAYLYPQAVSLNNPQPGHEIGELQDNLTASEEESLLNQMITQEEIEARQQQYQRLQQVLVKAINNLKPELQIVLQLYYGQQLNQQAIANQLSMQQYKVSRRLSQARKALIKSLIQWSQEQLHISPSTDLIKSVGNILEEWLQCYYQQQS